MNRSALMQQKTLTWGRSIATTINVTTGSFIGTPTGVPLQLSQLLRLEQDTPRPWLIQVVADVSGFAGETNPINLVVQAEPGVGQSQAKLLTSVVIAAPYAQYYDQGFLPGGHVQLSATLQGGPFIIAGQKSVVVSAFAAPWTAPGIDESAGLLAEVLAELRAMRQLLGGR